MNQISSQKQTLGLFGWLMICFVASAIGALATFKAPAIYAQLTQPTWAPPAWVVGPVWTTLYAMMAVAAWLIWRQGGFTHNRKALTWFFIQLSLNALWSWLFFAWMQGTWSFINIMLLWCAITVTLVMFWYQNKWAAGLLIPYLVWVSFAAALNFAMWQLNPVLLG